jgi:hypothetical protein
MEFRSPPPLSSAQRFGAAAFTLFALPVLAWVACFGYWLPVCGKAGWGYALIVLVGGSLIAPAVAGIAWAAGLGAMFAWHLHRVRKHRRLSILLSDAAILAVVLFFVGVMLGATLGQGGSCRLF